MPTWLYNIGGYTINSDLGYAQLEGNDVFADVNFGRWPISNEEELENIINKTIEMENKFRASSINPKRCTLISDWDYDFMSETTGTSFHDAIPSARGALRNDGYSDSFIFEREGGTTEDIITHLNNGSYFVLYRGHGSDNYWSGPKFTTANIRRDLNNSIYPIIFSNACKTGNFIQTNNDPCLGEQFIQSRYGACAFWGATCNTDHYANHFLNNHIFDDGFHGAQNISKIINLGISKFFNLINIWPSNDNKARSAIAYNLLGDPSLQIRFDECLNDSYFYYGETDENETLEYPVYSTITLSMEVEYENCYYKVKPNSELIIKARNEIILKSGFVAESGSKFRAYITNKRCSQQRSIDVFSPEDAENTESSSIFLEKDSNTISDAEIQIYPNPFTEILFLNFYCEQPENISIKLYNLQGILIQTISEEIYSSGYNELEINTSSLEKNVYIVEVIKGNIVYSYRVIKK